MGELDQSQVPRQALAIIACTGNQADVVVIESVHLWGSKGVYYLASTQDIGFLSAKDALSFLKKPLAHVAKGRMTRSFNWREKGQEGGAGQKDTHAGSFLMMIFSDLFSEI